MINIKLIAIIEQLAKIVHQAITKLRKSKIVTGNKEPVTIFMNISER